MWMKIKVVVQMTEVVCVQYLHKCSQGISLTTNSIGANIKTELIKTHTWFLECFNKSKITRLVKTTRLVVLHYFAKYRALI